jgi:hypothetical protein
MKQILHTALFLGLLLFVARCDSSEPQAEPTPTTGSIAGRVSLAPGVAGSIDNTRVAAYKDFADWANDRVLKQVAAASNGNYAINDLPPGSYYVDAWKDNNNSAQWDSGDYLQVYGSGSYPAYQPSPVSVEAGKVTTINMELIIIP